MARQRTPLASPEFRAGLEAALDAMVIVDGDSVIFEEYFQLDNPV